MDQLGDLVKTLSGELIDDLHKLSSSVVITKTIPTTIKQSYETITAVIASAESKQSEAFHSFTKSIDIVKSASLLNDIIQEQATLNYYNILKNIATETNTASKVSMITEAAKASAIMRELFNEHANYGGNYPSLGGNVALLVVFSIFLVVMVIQSVFYHQWWFLSCWSCGLILEIIGYVGRILNSSDVNDFNAFVMQLVCLTLAPCFMMAGVYYIIAQLALIYGEHYSVLKPMQYSLIFIVCDLISIILQAVGGGVASSEASEYKSTDSGSYIMVGGLAFQVLTIAVFQLFWYILLYRVYKEYKTNNGANFNPDFKHIRDRNLLFPFICGVSLAVVLVFVRSIYRLIELAEGWDGKLATKEIYFMILEALMVALNSIILCFFSPGIAYGRNSHIYIDKSLRNTFGRKKKNEECIEEGKIDDNTSSD
ncbi:hypothetical protein CANINC_003578 [Pichia inconspicua]|uniref:Sphingoid long-chain base transporter RSB1 n=1 Tax=Pichia inconspicua TaxID=52247 RepID=A0A4T0WZF9_9ASCO|nr:hypothetical protein CANINC_003578 [[Candida] inconspicua]